MNPGERITDLLLVPLLLLIGGLVALRLEGDLARRLEFPDSPYAGSEPVLDTRRPATGRVLVVLADPVPVDGATLAEMPGLQRLAADGSEAILAGPVPLDPLPGFVSMMSGAERPIHGVTAGFCRPAPDLLVRFDNLLLSMARSGRAARFVAPPPRGDRTDGWNVVAPVVEWEPCEVGSEASALRRDEADAPTRSPLEIVRLAIPGRAVRPDGTADREAVRAFDERLGAVAATVDPERETLVLVLPEARVRSASSRSDEPETPLSWRLVLVGRGVRPKEVPATGREQDVAPTLAALLGLPFPFGNSGAPLWGLLDLHPAERQIRTTDLADQQDRFVRACSERFALGLAPAAPPPSRAAEGIVDSRARQYRAVIGPRILVGLLLAAIFVFVVPRFRRLSAVLAGAAAGGILLALFFLLRNASFDLVELTARGGYAGFSGSFVLLGVLVGLVLSLGAGLLLPIARGDGPSVLAQRSILAAFGCILLLWAVATISWTRFRMPATGTPELNRWTLSYGAALLLVATVSFASLPGAAVAAARARFRGNEKR
jgi:hypothetical protein